KQVVPIDPMSLSTKARRRMRTSREETAILEDFYNKNPNPSNGEKAEIANTVKMGPRNVHFWFQNRRAKDNKRRKMIR
ncbi:Homeodomain-like protein, partial [Mucor mucedo]|uniref:Homeodomain-like protein n=1 Tax=Mucor mucedo TaxID=29922 RepID=UPI00222066A8